MKTIVVSLFLAVSAYQSIAQVAFGGHPLLHLVESGRRSYEGLVST